MIQKTVNKLPKSVVEVTINAPWEDVSAFWDKAVARVSSETEIAGFRKGTAPVGLVEQQTGNKIQDEFLKEAMSQILVSQLQTEQIVPIDYPKYELITFSKGQPLSFKATVTQRPQVQVGDYKNIKVAKPAPKEPVDEDVNKIVDDLFKRWKNKQSSAVSPQSSAQGQQNQPSSINFGGVPAVDTSNITEPNDIFAQQVGALGLTDLKNKIKQDLQSESKYNNELDYEELILQEVEKMTQVEVPDVLIEDELSRMLVSLQRRVSEMGLLLEDYLKSQNETLESIKDKWKEQATRNVRMELGLAEIARMEGVSITDQEVQAEVDKIQDGRLKAQFEQQEPRLHLKHSLRQIRTLELLKKFQPAA